MMASLTVETASWNKEPVLRQGLRPTHHMSSRNGRKWKWPKRVGIKYTVRTTMTTDKVVPKGARRPKNSPCSSRVGSMRTSGEGWGSSRLIRSHLCCVWYFCQLSYLLISWSNILSFFICLILTPRIRDSSSYCSSVTEKPGLTHYPTANTLSNG